MHVYQLILPQFEDQVAYAEPLPDVGWGKWRDNLVPTRALEVFRDYQNMMLRRAKRARV